MQGQWVPQLRGFMAIDLSNLGSYFSAQQSLSTSTRSSASAQAAAKAAIAALPPWDVRREQPSESERLRAALQTTKFVDGRNSSFDQPGVPVDHQKLFALYTALNTLTVLANEATKEETASGRLSGLDRRFQMGYTQVLDHLSSLELETATLITGKKSPKVETAFAVPRDLSQFTTRALKTGDATEPLAGIAGDEVFTVTVKKGAGTIAVAIDLADMGATPRALGDIVAFMNQKMADAGVISRFRKVEVPNTSSVATTSTSANPPKAWALKIEGVSTEELSFSAAVTQPALYVAGLGGTGDTVGGQLKKLTGLDATPTNAFVEKLSADDSTTRINASAIDSEGNVYVVGTTSGDFGNQVNQGAQDVVLRKYDSAGQVVWTKLLGASQGSEGFAIAVDGDDNVVIAGRLKGKLSSTATGGDFDSFVSKYAADGQEVFTRQAGALVEDGATALTVGADGAIYVGGYTRARIGSGATHGGGTDAYVTKLSAAGTLVYNRQFGGSGDEKIASLAIGSDGNLVASSVEGTNAVVRKFTTADATTAALWQVDLGALSGGALGGLAVDGSNIYVAGGTGNAALTAGGQASATNAHSGGLDGFVLRIDDQGASATAATVTYLGSATVDRINGIAVSGGEVYVTGDTTGTLPGATQTRVGATNAFAAKLETDGTLDWVHQFGGSDGVGSGQAIVVDTAGSSVLDALGLPRGAIDYSPSRTITAQSTVRTGDYFYVSVDGKREKRITIEAGETVRSLSLKINRVLLFDGKASVAKRDGADILRVEATRTKSIEFRSGAGDMDALKGLGIAPGRVVKEADDEDAETNGSTSETDEEPLPMFGLGLTSNLSLTSRTDAAKAKESISDAMAIIRKAYRELTRDPRLDALAEQSAKKRGPVSASLTRQLANYQAGLARLTGGSSSGSLF